MIRRLDRVVPAASGKPERAGAAETQRLARAVAQDAAAWDADRARQMAARFDELAAVWDSERGGYRAAPLRDALARGGPWPPGLCVEVGAGTGLLTGHLREAWPEVVAVDLSHEMLRRARQPWRVRADAARLPLRDHVAAAVVIGDAPLLAAEVARVLAAEGIVVWSNALGTGAPFHLPTADVAAALQSTSGHAWDAVESDAAWGSWAVLRRSP